MTTQPPRKQFNRDRKTIKRVMEMRGGPILFSQIAQQAGEGLWGPFDEMIRQGEVEAVFPEAKPGDSGRQFWVLSPVSSSEE